jgi:hypothetical protein
MTHMKYITNNNLDHFMQLLERADNDADRSRYQSLLVSEEDRFAQKEDRLEARRRCLAQARGKLHRQAQLVVEIRDNEGDTTEAENC